MVQHIATRSCKVTLIPKTMHRATAPLLLAICCAAAVNLCIADAYQLKSTGTPKRRVLQDTLPSPPNPKYPCSASGQAGDAIYMTAVSKCPKDAYYIAYVVFGPEYGSGDVTRISGADATPVQGATQHAWRGPYWNGVNHTANQGIRVVVLRASDGKVITPKGVKADGSFYDISSTRKPVCQLLELGSNPLRFAVFRGLATADGTHVLRDDFGSNEYRASIPRNGVACEQYRDVGGSLGRSVTVGKMVNSYLPGSCLFGIDDCSS